jgi:hypothetical protein
LTVELYIIIIIIQDWRCDKSIRFKGIGEPKQQTGFIG